MGDEPDSLLVIARYLVVGLRSPGWYRQSPVK